MSDYSSAILAVALAFSIMTNVALFYQKFVRPFLVRKK